MNSNRNSYRGEESHSSIEQLEWNKLKSDRMKEGYREGISAGEETSSQEGFNLGYIEGFQILEEAAKLRGTITAVTERLHQEEESKECAKVLTSQSPGEIVIRLMELTTELSMIETKMIEEASSTAAGNNVQTEETKRPSLHGSTNFNTRIFEIKSECANILKDYNTSISKLFQ